MGTFKILCVSDHIDPLVYSDSIKERFSDIDMVLGAGDLDLSYYGYIVSMLNTPLAFVFGNHNLKQISHYRREYRADLFQAERDGEFLQKSYGSTYVGGKAINFQGLLIAGLGGSIIYNRGRNQFTETQMFFRILKLVPKLLFFRVFYKRWVDILLTHAPPKDIHDREDRCHRGFKTFLWFMKLFKPKYLVHGHVHLYDLNEVRTSEYMQTKVVNAYEHTVIEIEV
ncbi:MAG: metallophosphoesterase [Spirochaetia bacterium]